MSGILITISYVLFAVSAFCILFVIFFGIKYKTIDKIYAEKERPSESRREDALKDEGLHTDTDKDKNTDTEKSAEDIADAVKDGKEDKTSISDPDRSDLDFLFEEEKKEEDKKEEVSATASSDKTMPADEELRPEVPKEDMSGPMEIADDSIEIMTVPLSEAASGEVVEDESETVLLKEDSTESKEMDDALTVPLAGEEEAMTAPLEGKEEAMTVPLEKEDGDLCETEDMTVPLTEEDGDVEEESLDDDGMTVPLKTSEVPEGPTDNIEDVKKIYLDYDESNDIFEHDGHDDTVELVDPTAELYGDEYPTVPLDPEKADKEVEIDIHQTEEISISGN